MNNYQGKASVIGDLTDRRDRTIFVEYFPTYCITSVWREDGTLDYFNAAATHYAKA